MINFKIKTFLFPILICSSSFTEAQIKLDSTIKLNWLKMQKQLSAFIVPKDWNFKTFDTEIITADLYVKGEKGSDFDGLTDKEEKKIKTNPLNPDTDGDGLPDGWEVNGTAGLNLRDMGASPLHKDIFVEMDYMTRASAANGLVPNASVLKRIEDSFSQAPVNNPDGTSGINIHLVLGNEIPYIDDLVPYDQIFYNLKEKNFNPRLAPVFHYMIWANAYNRSNSSGISMNVPSSDFIVTLGRWNGGNGGTDDQKVGTFIHELGHNLGLLHGGNEDLNYKPNHLSVMNYFFQVEGVQHSNGHLYTYQPFSLRVLNEGRLAEERGIGKDVFLNGYFTRYFDINKKIIEVPASSSVDWNNNAVMDAGLINWNLNGDKILSELSATPDEWSSLIYNGGSIGLGGYLFGILESLEKQVKEVPIDELTEDQFLEMKK